MVDLSYRCLSISSVLIFEGSCTQIMTFTVTAVFIMVGSVEPVTFGRGLLRGEGLSFPLINNICARDWMVYIGKLSYLGGVETRTDICNTSPDLLQTF